MPTRSTGFSPEVRAIIIDRAVYRCERCGEQHSDMQAHHRRPRGMGGTKRPGSNLPSAGVWLCGQCHRIVESHRDQAFDDGFLVRQSHNPAEVKVAYRKYSTHELDVDHCGRAFLLGDDGSLVPSDWEGEVA